MRSGVSTPLRFSPSLLYWALSHETLPCKKKNNSENMHHKSKNCMHGDSIKPNAVRRSNFLPALHPSGTAQLFDYHCIGPPRIEVLCQDPCVKV